MSKKTVHDVITEQILKLLEEGVAPWRKPWKSRGSTGGGMYLPMNIQTKRAYRGGNIFLLWGAALYKDLNSAWWGTWKAWERKGYAVMEEEKNRQSVVYVYKPIPIYAEEDKHLPEEERELIYVKPFLRYFQVWNGDQIEGFEDPNDQVVEEPEEENEDFTPMEIAEALVEDYIPQVAELIHGGNRASYNPGTDVIRMPEPEQFAPAEEYYSTLYHELVHSTGHHNRLDREGVSGATYFGDKGYSFEELIAEMGAAMLAAQAGIAGAIIENSAAYIAGWQKSLSDNPKWIVQAGAKAQKAADLIMGVTWDGMD